MKQKIWKKEYVTQESKEFYTQENCPPSLKARETHLREFKI